MTPPLITIVKLDHGADLPLPSYQTQGAAGLDLMAALEADIIIAPGAFKAIPTGLTMAIPQGYEVQIRPRSGLAFKQGVTVLNSPGTIDSDYRGEVKIALINHGAEPVTISHGMRIAQMVVASVARATLTESDRLDNTKRGTGGFGSTGTTS